ncbi:hypothetical protein AAJCM20276_34450 [Acetobacter aceti]|uniref:Uncharacterized protein n=1 Tax=Acetobacter aceti TaxID=435 RepID=A0A6S6PQ59_ACEAC|nr:hypothetical protein AAJCM20276_34450 [Acetobacter aceti]
MEVIVVMTMERGISNAPVILVVYSRDDAALPIIWRIERSWLWRPLSRMYSPERCSQRQNKATSSKKTGIPWYDENLKNYHEKL